MDSVNTYVAVAFVTILFIAALVRIAIQRNVNKVLIIADVDERLQNEVKRDILRDLKGYTITFFIIYFVALGLVLSGYMDKWPLITLGAIAVLLIVLLGSLISIVQRIFNEAIESIGWAKDLQRDCEVHEGFVVQVISNDNNPAQIFVETGDIVESRIKEFLTEDDVSDFYIKWGEPEDRGVIIYSSLNRYGNLVIHHLIKDEEDSTFNLLYA